MEWVQLIQGQFDVMMIGAISVLTFFIVNTIGDDWPRVRKWVGLILPLGAGSLWGYYLAKEANYGVGSFMLKGLLVQGTGAITLSYIAELVMPKLLTAAANKIPTVLGVTLQEGAATVTTAKEPDPPTPPKA